MVYYKIEICVIRVICESLFFIRVICKSLFFIYEISERIVFVLLLDKQSLFRIVANAIRHRSFANGNTLFRLAWLPTETGYNDYYWTDIDLAGNKT